MLLDEQELKASSDKQLIAFFLRLRVGLKSSLSEKGREMLPQI